MSDKPKFKEDKTWEEMKAPEWNIEYLKEVRRQAILEVLNSDMIRAMQNYIKAWATFSNGEPQAILLDKEFDLYKAKMGDKDV